MFKIKVLNHDVLKEILEMRMVIDAIENVYVLKAEEKTELFDMVFHEFKSGIADMDIKSGHLKGVNIFGLKLVSWFGENKEKNLPLLIGTTLIFDSNTGVPLALLNADHITGMRTGAAGAIGAKYLAKKSSKNLLVVGTGHVAKFEIAATLMTLEHIDTVRIYNPFSVEKANAYVQSIPSILKKEFNLVTKVNFEAVTHLESAVKSSDVIITVTPSREKMILKEWVQPGTHFSCIGADMSGKQEIDEEIFRIARIFVDDVNQAINLGETEMAYKKHIITKTDILGEIGDVINKKVPGRISDEDITIFDSTGIAIQDLITAKLALDLAEEKNLGISIDL